LASDTGLRGAGNTALSTGSGVTAMQVDLRSTDFNRSHRFTVRADPENQIAERDESNNSLTVVVDMPAEPRASGDVPCRL
jgi:subtilase family serine protease